MNLLLTFAFLVQTPCISSISIEDGYRQTNVPVSIPSPFSKWEKKRWFFSQDSYFRESNALFSNTFQRHADLDQFFKNISFVIVRPDGIAAHSIGKTVEALREVGFEPIHYEIVKFDRHSNRLFWWYHLNHAPLDRFPLVDLFINDRPCALIFVKANEPNEEFACQRLARVKGHVLTEKRKPDQIRYKINAGRGLLAYIHAPDEPIDIMRELGILFPSSQLQNLLEKMMHPPEFNQSLLEEQMYAKSIAHNLDFTQSTQRIQSICNAFPDLQEMCQDALTGKKIDWQYFVQQVKKYQLPIDEWDLIVFCASTAEEELSGIESMYLQ
jgi:nucleoside diphosphate kinase